MRWIAAVTMLLAALLVPPAAAQPVTPADASAPARAVAALPSELPGFRRVGEVTDFERRPGGAGLGASVRYRPTGAERIVATVFVYDRGLKDLTGAAEAAVAEELRAAHAELDGVARMGRYRSVAADQGLAMTGPGGTVRCATFRIVQQDGQTTGDAACVAVRAGRFLKVRITNYDSADPAVAGLLAGSIAGTVLDSRIP